MTQERYQEITSMLNEWVYLSDIRFRDALFALYDDRMITGAELDIFIDKLDGRINRIQFT